MAKLESKPVTFLKPDHNQPRKHLDEANFGCSAIRWASARYGPCCPCPTAITRSNW